MRGHRHGVLLVDEEGDLRDAVQELLTRRGLEVLSARHGRAALQLIALGFRPCVILVDLRKPSVAGAEFRRAQQYDPGLREIPVVVLTEWTPPLDADGLLATADRHCAGGDAFRRSAHRPGVLVPAARLSRVHRTRTR